MKKGSNLRLIDPLNPHEDEKKNLSQLMEPGDRIKKIMKRDLKRQDDYIALTQNGHLIELGKNFESHYSRGDKISSTIMPQLHSELPPSRIEDVVAVHGVIFVLTKDGEIYASLTKVKAS